MRERAVKYAMINLRAEEEGNSQKTRREKITLWIYYEIIGAESARGRKRNLREKKTSMGIRAKGKKG